MAKPENPINAADANTNSPPGIGLSPDAQFRTLSARLEEVASEVSKLAKPKEFRLADLMSLAMIIIGLAVAFFTAMGLKDRIDDLVKAEMGSETRITGQVTASEARVNAKLDRMDDRFTRLDERTATLEGARQGKH